MMRDTGKEGRLVNGARNASEQQGAALCGPLLLHPATRGVGVEATASTIRVMTIIGQAQRSIK